MPFVSKNQPTVPFAVDEAGAVPAPTAGDASNFLRGDGTWAPAAGGSNLYDAVVPDDYSLPSAAFADSKARVWVRPGTYVETADVVIPNRGCLHGASGVTIVLGSYQVKADGQARKTTAGTIAVTNGSATVTGTGTAFTGLLAGDFIAIGPDFYEIATTPVSTTSLTLTQTYRGRTLSGLTYVAQQMFRGITINNMIFANSTHVDGCVYFRGVLDSVYSKSLVTGSTLNLNLVDSGNMGISEVSSNNSGSDGLRMTDCRSIVVSTGHYYNNVAFGANITGSHAISLYFNSVEFTMNGSTGAQVNGSATDTRFVNCGSKYNQGKGINTEPGTVRCIIAGCTVQNNQGVNIDVDGTQNIVNSCEIGNGAGDGIFGGSQCQISDNFIHNNSGVGVSFNGDSNTVCTGNTIANNGGTGIAMTTSSDCVITSNRIIGNGGWGLSIGASSNRNRVGSNVYTGNTSGSVTDAAVDTKYVDNVCTNVNANSAITTTSTTHILASGMSITPPRGTYAVIWAAAVSTNSTSNRHAYIQIYAGGVAQGSEIGAERGDSSTDNEIGITTTAKVTVNGSQAIEGRWRTIGSTGEMYGRSMIIIQVA